MTPSLQPNNKLGICPIQKNDHHIPWNPENKHNRKRWKRSNMLDVLLWIHPHIIKLVLLVDQPRNLAELWESSWEHTWIIDGSFMHAILSCRTNCRDSRSACISKICIYKREFTDRGSWYSSLKKNKDLIFRWVKYNPKFDEISIKILIFTISHKYYYINYEIYLFNKSI